jgi:iron complex outermembrane receptor protein
MKVTLLLAFLPAICLCGPANLIHAQQSPLPAATPIETGSIAGVLKDPSGAVVPGAKIELRSLVRGFKGSMETDQQGRFVFSPVPAGRYRVTITARGFDIAVLPDLAVTAGTETAANLTLKIAPAKAFVEVNDSTAETATRHTVDATDEARSHNAAELVGSAPGVSLRENGQLASIPFLHGLGDERTKLVVDGMTVSSACPNHMNPPLSSIAPSMCPR